MRLAARAAVVALMSLAAPASLPRHAVAQTAGVLMEQGRARLDQLDPDSAFQLLQRALGSGDVAAPVRVRAFTLLGITELLRSNRLAARQAFERAIRLDPALAIDTLADLHSDARVVFGEARTAVGPLTRVFAVTVDLPADTVIRPGQDRLRLDVRPTARARVAFTVAPIETPQVLVWADTQTVDLVGRVLWDLAAPDSAYVADGRYVIHVTATDASGEVAPPVERILYVARLPVDTAAHPPAFDSTTLMPEALRIPRAAPSRLLLGAALGMGALLTPSLLGSGDVGGGGGRSVAIGGVVTLAGIVGFLAGHRTRPLPENVDQNRQLLDRDANQRGVIAAANARLLAAAPIRILVESAAR